MAARFKFSVDKNTADMISRIKSVATSAAVKALRQTAVDIVDEGRANIASSGRFGSNWQRDLQFRMMDTEEGGAPSLNAKAIIFHKSRLAGVFESGVTIAGKPLLWIPTTPGAPSPRRSGRKLISATVRRMPMLFDATDRDRHRRPLY